MFVREAVPTLSGKREAEEEAGKTVRGEPEHCVLARWFLISAQVVPCRDVQFGFLPAASSLAIM